MKNDYQINDCIWDSSNPSITWEKMLLSALDDNHPWISIDMDTNHDRNPINVISCLGPGCNKNECPIVKNIIAVLVQNGINGIRRSIGVVIKLEFIDTINPVSFENGKREYIFTFLFTPSIKSEFFSSSKKRVLPKLIALNEEGLKKCVSISILVSVLRDITTNLHSYSYPNEIDWNSKTPDEVSKIRLYANLK